MHSDDLGELSVAEDALDAVSIRVGVDAHTIKIIVLEFSLVHLTRGEVIFASALS